MGRYARRRSGRQRLVAASTALALVVALGAGCGGGADPTAGGPPRIVSARVVDSHVRVEYRVPGADGGEWPRMSISVLEPETGLPPSSQDIYKVNQKGSVTVRDQEVGPQREVIVYGSVFYEDGRRLHMPELRIHSPATATGSLSNVRPGSAAARRNCQREEERRISPRVDCGGR